MNQTEHQRPRLKIIGLGSPFGADQLGLQVVTQLEQAISHLSQVSCVALDRPGAALIAEFEDIDHCWLIDALVSKEPVGTYLQLTPEAVIASSQPCTSVHGFGVSETLALAQPLGKLPRNLEIHALSVGPDPSLTEECPPALVQGQAQLVETLMQRLLEQESANNPVFQLADTW